MGPDQMPRLIEGTGTVGHVRDALADELGLPRGTPVIAGGADNAAAACASRTWPTVPVPSIRRGI
ncbi:MAG: hypothetical protein AAFN51_05030 [Pseudomonadota bacterium]